jgi:hypothetical protein
MVFDDKMFAGAMTPTRIRERLEETDERIDPTTYVEALQYVRDDGR